MQPIGAVFSYQAWGRKYSTTSPNRLLTPEDALREAKARYDAKPRSNSVSLPLSPSKSSNLDGGTPTRGHNHELRPKTNIRAARSFLTIDEARKAYPDFTKRSSMSSSPSLSSRRGSNIDGETAIRGNKLTDRQPVCEWKAEWIRKNLCCCFYKSEQQTQV